jgi:hypothetical protein
MKPRAAGLALVVVLSAASMRGVAEEFSADVVYTATPSEPGVQAHVASASPAGRIYVSKDLLRLESFGVSRLILIVNSVEHRAVALFPAQHAYQEMPASALLYFRAADANNACADWQQAAARKIVCEKVGSEIAAGRPAVKYENKSAGADPGTTAVWVDSALKFVTRWQNTKTAAELHDIKEGPQPAALFEVPQGYEVLKVGKKGWGKPARRD